MVCPTSRHDARGVPALGIEDRKRMTLPLATRNDTPLSSPGLRWHGLVLAAALMLPAGLGGLVGLPQTAAGQIIIGGDRAVEVDLSVLDALDGRSSGSRTQAPTRLDDTAAAPRQGWQPPRPPSKPRAPTLVAEASAPAVAPRPPTAETDVLELSTTQLRGAPSDAPTPSPAPAPAAAQPAPTPEPPPAPAAPRPVTPPPVAPTAPAPAEAAPVPQATPQPPAPAPAVEAPTVEAPAVEATPAPDPAPATEVAALPPDDALPTDGRTIDTLPGGEGFRIVFDPTENDLNEASGSLLSGLAQRMIQDESLRLQIRSFAGGSAETASQARRLSLNRALMVRTFLIDRGVRGTRIDVRALGNTAPDGPADRIDLLFDN